MAASSAENSSMRNTTSPESRPPRPLAPSSSGLNPRSCVTCRRRKVKCDKKHPCSNCIRQGIECIFPAPGRAPRKPRKPQDQELVERLRRLENVVQTLGAQVQNEDLVTEEEKELETPEEKIQKFHEMKKELKAIMREKMEKEQANGDAMDNLTQRFGTLLVNKGRSRYINPGFWSHLNSEVEDIKGELFELSDEPVDEDYPSPSTSNTSTMHQGFIFGLSSINVQMTLLYPLADHIGTYWQVYKENVDPLMKILHTPTRDPVVANYAKQLDNLPKDSECLLFAICYAAVSASWPEDCKRLWGESKSDLLQRYRFGMEQALARADFLQTDSIFVLQSFIIYLTCLRRNSDARVVWSMAALAVRISQGLGLHRDGSHYPTLPPYKQELRRRLWWHAVLLDSRACEDLGSDPTVYEMMSDTKFPLNINDSDIDFDMKELPESRKGLTDVTFTLIRCEVGRVLRRIAYQPPGHHAKRHCHMHMRGPGLQSLEKKRKILVKLKDDLEEKYFKDADLSIPMNWVTATVTRLIISKMWLMLYQPFQRQDGGQSLPREVRDELFQRALENVEYSIAFHKESRSEEFRRYAWLLQTYTQWHAIAFLLSELRQRTLGPDVDRAWEAVDNAMTRAWEDGMEVSKVDGHLWRPLKILKEKAKAEREKALAQLQAPQDLAFDVPAIPDLNAGAQLFQIGDKQTSAFEQNPFEKPFGGDTTNDPMGLWPTHTQLNVTLPSDPVPFNPTIGATPQAVARTASSGQIIPTQIATIHATTMPLNQAIPLPQEQLPLPDFNSTDWMNVGMGDTNMAGDENVNWAAWDDMVQEWGMKSEQGGVDVGQGPSYMFNGASWF